MGNSCHAVRGLWLLKNKDCSLHLQLGKSASIDLKGGEIEHKSDGKVTETWRLSYTVEGSSCTFTLVKTTGGPRPEELEAYIMDNIRKNIKGNIEEHSFIFRDTAETAGWNGLLCEHAQDSSVRISSPTDELQHPSSALLYMFEQVSRTQTWNPTACPHCADIRKQRSMFLHFETDQTESSEDSDNFPPARRHGATQNAGSVLANDGVIKGNNNGNFNVRRFIFGGRR
ncbi:hypothetical protein SESBI_42787 [Sesbania bispinosa]|nr:hypothetical protein SESBI_42787 [Sesbania bispinosa]